MNDLEEVRASQDATEEAAVENVGEEGMREVTVKVDPARERLQIGSAALGVSFIFIVTLLVQLMLDLLLSLTLPAARESVWYGVLMSVLPMYGIAMPLSLLLFSMGRAEPPAPKKLSIPLLLGAFAFCFSLSFAGSLVGTLLNFLISLVTGEMPQNALQNTTTSMPLWANLLTVGILAPIMEELFFRRAVIDRLRRYGELRAVLISGIVFGLIHGNLYQFFYAAMIGIVLGMIYVRTGKVRYTVAIHMGINLIGGVYASETVKLADRIAAAGEQASPLWFAALGVMNVIYYGILGVSLLGAALFLVCLLRRKREPLLRGTHSMTARQWGLAAGINPAVWVLAALIVLLFVANFV